MIKFMIPYPPTKAGKTAWNKRYGLNAYYAGKHHQVRKKTRRSCTPSPGRQ